MEDGVSGDATTTDLRIYLPPDGRASGAWFQRVRSQCRFCERGQEDMGLVQKAEEAEHFQQVEAAAQQKKQTRLRGVPKSSHKEGDSSLPATSPSCTSPGHAQLESGGPHFAGGIHHSSSRHHVG